MGDEKPVKELWSRLSRTLTGPRDLSHCQSCGTDEPPLTPYQEHDDADQPEPIAVMLCRRCAYDLVEVHQRLYRSLAKWEPFPGVMLCCIGCRHAQGMDCKHPLLKRNGGPGLILNVPKPSQAIACTRGRGGCKQVIIYSGPVKCTGRELLTEAAGKQSGQE